MREETVPATRIVVATGNAHKVVEIQDSIQAAQLPYEFISLSECVQTCESPAEDGESFEANAAIKARAAFRLLGLPALADDSGLVVDALGGAPGIYSSRYAGHAATDAANNAKLLRELGERTDRRARFVSSLVLVGLDKVLPSAPAYLTVSGTVSGQIAFACRGAGGFGYDPLFVPDLRPTCTMAELSLAEKSRISHRGAALRALVDVLRNLS